ncbi:MAG: hypothetical protein NVS1B7_0890 [Candidatus Saccharimonadales bacterium]
MMLNINSNNLFSPYMTTIDGERCYLAGFPSYPRNFSRDALIAGILACDVDLIKTQLLFSLKHQGRKEDYLTGEEPGKMHHEYPGVSIHPPYLTMYNACDTTALFMIGLELLSKLDSVAAKDILKLHLESIILAVKYIQNHVSNDLFWDFPPDGAPFYALHTTYWKDSILPNPTGNEKTMYPISYSLVQFQVARGLLAAGKLLGKNELVRQAYAMFTVGIKEYVRVDSFCIERNQYSRLCQISSDELHALAYIPKDFYAMLPLNSIKHRAKTLITEAGITCTSQAIGEQLSNQYHGYVVWIFEQALIHYGCQKFGLDELQAIAKRCIPYMNKGEELLTIIPEIKPTGNDRQLWSVAAKIYFSDESSLRSLYAL